MVNSNGAYSKKSNECAVQLTLIEKHAILYSCRFPREFELREKWRIAIRRENWQLSQYSMVCSTHFREEDLDKSSPFLTKLMPGVIPSKFPTYPQHLHKEAPKVNIRLN